MSIRDKRVDRELLPARTGYWNGPVLRYLRPGTKEPGDYLALTSSRRFRSQSESVNGNATLTLTWDNFSDARMPQGASVTLDIVIDADSPLTQWTPRIQSALPASLYSIEVPSLNGIQQISENPINDEFVYPALAGLIVKDPLHSFRVGRGYGFELYYPSGYANMQFMAYYTRERGTGLYVAAYDRSGHMKYLNMTRTHPEWMSMGIVHMPAWVEATSWKLAYPVVVGVVRGDWYDAAQTYRRWAVQQPWTARGNVTGRTDLPAWLRETGAMGFVFTRSFTRPPDHWNGPYSSLARIASSVRQALSAPLTFLWYGWERNGAWGEAPEFTPPTEGWPSFGDAVAKLHAEGGRVWIIPTTNWHSTAVRSWSEAVGQATIGPDGRPRLSQTSFLDANGRGQTETVAMMDPSPYWAQRLWGLAGDLVRRGVDMMQMDGNVARPTLCYADNHPHPAGGGNWWTTMTAALLRHVREQGRTVSADWTLGAEYYAEPYLADLDAAKDPLHTGIDRAGFLADAGVPPGMIGFVPLWQTVYHDYTVTYSMFGFMVGKDVSFYRHGLAEAFIWGEIPHLAFDPPGTFDAWDLKGYDQTMLDYLGRMANVRRGVGRQFVVEGRMLRAPILDVPVTTVGPATDIPYTLANAGAFTAPAVMASAWQTQSGRLGVLLTNITETSIRFTVPLDPGALELDSSGATYRLTEVIDGRVGPSVSVTVPSSVGVDLRPMEIRLLVLDRE